MRRLETILAVSKSLLSGVGIKSSTGLILLNPFPVALREFLMTTILRDGSEHPPVVYFPVLSQILLEPVNAEIQSARTAVRNDV